MIAMILTGVGPAARHSLAGAQCRYFESERFELRRLTQAEFVGQDGGAFVGVRIVKGAVAGRH